MNESEVDCTSENPLVVRTPDELNAIDWNVRNQYLPPEPEGSQNPWIASVVMLTPVQYANQAMRKAAPDEALGIEWIYGYQAEKCRNSVRYNFQGDLVYNVSKYAIVYNFNRHEQRIFSGHTEEILCLTMHPVSELPHPWKGCAPTAIHSQPSLPFPTAMPCPSARLLPWVCILQTID